MNAEELHDLRIEAIANRVKELRKKAGFTSYETFAQHHDIDRKHYWRIESGQNTSLKTLFRILDIHRLTPLEFFEGVKFPK